MVSFERAREFGCVAHLLIFDIRSSFLNFLDGAGGLGSPMAAILGPMPDVSDYVAMIEAALPGASATVLDQGGGDHLFAEVVAPQFGGLSRIEQHRMVYAAVKRYLDDGSIHALALKTRTPED
jgi:stress-induced morphogen